MALITQGGTLLWDVLSARASGVKEGSDHHQPQAMLCHSLKASGAELVPDLVVVQVIAILAILVPAAAIKR